MHKVIQQNQTINNNANASKDGNPTTINSSSSTRHHFTFVLRRGLRNLFRPLFITKIISSYTGPGVALPLPRRSSTYIAKSRHIRIAGVLSSFILILIAIATIAPLTHNTQYTEAIGTASETTLTISATDYPVLDLAVNSSDGTFTETTSTTGQGKFTVTTTNYTGYTLSIQNSSSSTDLTATGTGTSGTGTSTIASIPTGSSLTSAQFNNATYNGKWGYKPSKLNSQPNSNYIPSPTTTATTLNITNCANGQSNGSNTCPDTVDNYTIDLAARLQYTQDAGNYTNTFIITAVANKIDYQITYADESSTSSDIPSAEDDETDLTYITLSSTIPTREGYTFQGWCTTSTGADGTNPCTGTTYQPGDQYPINQTTQNLATLYAMWKVNAVDMQDLTDSACQVNVGTNGNPANVGDTINVKDVRDNELYTVRYINGACWMTQNLRYVGDTGSASGSMTIKSATTNSADKTLSYTDLTSGDTYNSARIHVGVDNNNDATVWYNYAAASAGTITGNPNETDATRDICPKGWKLPPYSGTGSIGSITSYKDAFSPVYGGYYDGGSRKSASTIGYWWSTKTYDINRRFFLYYVNGSLSASLNSNTDTGYRSYGYYVRCVKKSDFEKDPLTALESGTAYLQDFGNLSSTDKTNLINKMEPEKAYYVTDSRDNEGYNIAKLADGKVWLLDNLRLGSTSSMTLRKTDTNITASTYTLPASISSGFDSYTAAKINTASKATNATYSNKITSSSFNANGTAKIGVYYNYCAATAGGICSSSNSSNASADRDICPKGWRMPTGGGSGEYQALYTAYSSNYQNFQTALRTPLSGVFTNSSASNQRYYGYFWSATRSSSTNMFYLRVDDSSVSPQDRDDIRNCGYSVRCVLK